MKNNLKKIAALLLVVFALASSASNPNVTISPKNSEKIDTIVLISTNLIIEQPVIPLLDAAALNGEINTISKEIILMFNDNINIVRDTVACLLQNTLKCNVIYAEALHTLPGFKELKEKYDFKSSLETGNVNFPEIVTAKADINPFKFEKGKIEKYFRVENNYTNTIAEICKVLNENFIAVSETRLQPVPGDGSFFSPDLLYMHTNLYLFDKNGKCIASETNHLPRIKFKASELNDYQKVINNESATIKPIIQKIAAKY